MGELTTRGYRDSDAPDLADLLNRIEEHVGGHPYMTAEEAQALMRAMIRDHETDARVVVDGGTDVPIAFAAVPTPPEGGFRVDLMGGVDPRRRGRGIGRELFEWQLRRAADIHAAAAPERDWAIHVGGSDADTDAHRLYRRFGLAPVRYWFDMVAPTTAVPDVPVPDGLDVVRYRPGRDRDLYAAHIEAFADHWGFQAREEEFWRTLTVESGDFLPDLSRVALDGKEIAGYVLTYSSPEPGRGYVGQVGVRRTWRRRGLAAVMLTDVLRAAGAAGLGSLALGVDADSPTGAVGVYERVGFAVESRGVTYAVALPARSPAARQPS
jgi:mycothiol synthase